MYHEIRKIEKITKSDTYYIPKWYSTLTDPSKFQLRQNKKKKTKIVWLSIKMDSNRKVKLNLKKNGGLISYTLHVECKSVFRTLIVSLHRTDGQNKKKIKNFLNNCAVYALDQRFLNLFFHRGNL